MLADAQFTQQLMNNTASLSAFAHQHMFTTSALVGLGVIALFSVKAASKSEEKNQPPLVKYTFPLLGSTIEYVRNPKAFLAKCTDQYGPVFRINVLGKIQTFVGKDSVRDVFLNDGFSFTEAVRDTVDFSYFLSIDDATITHNVISTLVTPNLSRFVPLVAPYLIQEMDRFLDVGQDSVKIQNRVLTEQMVARAISRIFVGSELCKNDELIEIFRSFASDVGRATRGIGPLLFLPGPLSMRLQRLIFSITNPIGKHRDVCIKIIGPEIDQRRRAMAELGDGFERPDDILQSMIEKFPEWSSKKISMFVLDLVFVSVDTTSDRSGIVLDALATYPQYIPELIEEQEEVLSTEPPNEYGIPYTMGSLKKMVKLDSFVREALRLQAPNLLGFPHKNISNDDMLLSNGVKISKGERVNINVTEIHSVEEETPFDPKFNPWRFVGKNENIARVGPEYVVFGLGKHACPGRWLAAAELKTIAALFVTRYVVGFGEPHPDQHTHTTLLEFSRRN